MKSMNSQSIEASRQARHPSRLLGYRTRTPVFPGCCGPLHQSTKKEVDLISPDCDLFKELPFQEMVRMAYMFNFNESAGILSNKRRVKLQLDDTDWSRPFTLESVGVNQVISIDHQQRGLLEIGLHISIAPGRLAKYTKIVRFLPRFAIVNRLNSTLKVLQPSGLSDTFSEIEVSSNHIRAYHLPEMLGERQIALQMEGPWKRTVAFSLDQIGSFTLQVKTRTDLASIPHVNTRGAPEYIEVIPALKSLGLAFETDWKEVNIVVRSIQTGSYAARSTDIKVGDVLLSIDDEPVTGAQFEIAMMSLRAKLADQGCKLTFRTVEEKLRLIRESALQNVQRASNERRRAVVGSATTRLISSPAISRSRVAMLENSPEQDCVALRVELRQVESSTMIMVSEMTAEFNTEYKIENKSVCYRIHYKQRGIAGSSWNTLNPGESCSYVWEDPFKPHKLVVHVGENLLSPGDNRNKTTLNEGGELGERGRGDESLGTYLGHVTGVKNDSATVINLDEIGCKEYLLLGNGERKLAATVRSEGPTKVLIVSPDLEKPEMYRELQYCTEFATQQINSIQELIDKLRNLIGMTEQFVGGESESAVRLGSVANLTNETLDECVRQLCNYQKQFQHQYLQSFHDIVPIELGDNIMKASGLVSYQTLTRLYEAAIDRPRQLLVEVLEARELSPFVVGKTEDTYCKIYLRNEDRGNFME